MKSLVFICLVVGSLALPAFREHSSKFGSHHTFMVHPYAYSLSTIPVLPFPQVVYPNLPSIYSSTKTGTVFPLAQTHLQGYIAEPYIHDTTGDISDDAASEVVAYAHESTGDIAEPYIHDTTGDISDDAASEAVAYVHDATGDFSNDDVPEVVAYIHDNTGDVPDDTVPVALNYFHDTTGDEAEPYIHDPTGDEVNV